MSLEDYVTPLVPVSEWEFYLYKVTYWKEERDEHQPHKVLWMVDTDTHIGDTVQREWPSDYYVVVTFDEQEGRVPRPRQIGTNFGHRVDEGPRAAGEREAKKRGLL